MRALVVARLVAQEYYSAASAGSRGPRGGGGEHATASSQQWPLAAALADALWPQTGTALLAAAVAALPPAPPYHPHALAWAAATGDALAPSSRAASALLRRAGLSSGGGGCGGSEIEADFDPAALPAAVLLSGSAAAAVAAGLGVGCAVFWEPDNYGVVRRRRKQPTPTPPHHVPLPTSARTHLTLRRRPLGQMHS